MRLMLVFAMSMGFLPIRAVAAGEGVEGRAKSHFERGETHYRLGQFEAAFDEYSKAYALMALPDLLFNMGQCQRNLRNYRRAIFFFEKFVATAPPAEGARVRRLIEELENIEMASVGSDRGERARDPEAGASTSTAAVDSERAPDERAQEQGIDDAARSGGDSTGQAAAFATLGRELPGAPAGRGAEEAPRMDEMRPNPWSDAGKTAAAPFEEPPGSVAGEGLLGAWWFWAAVGVAVAAGAGGVIAASRSSGGSVPAGSMGVIDARPSAER